MAMVPYKRTIHLDHTDLTEEQAERLLQITLKQKVSAAEGLRQLRLLEKEDERQAHLAARRAKQIKEEEKVDSPVVIQNSPPRSE